MGRVGADGSAAGSRPGSDGLIPRKRLGFVAATVSLVGVFAGSASPIPLYEHYRAVAGLSTGDLSIAAVSYFVAVMFALVVLGRQSDHLGRRLVSLAAVALAVAGCLVLLEVDGLSVLVLGRILQGLSCGLASSALTAYIVDSLPTDRGGWRPPRPPVLR